MNELSQQLEVLVNKMAPRSEPQKQDILARLNNEQTEAVCQGWGPSLIVAGAGSGKTTVLTRRVAFLIKEMHQDADSIMAVTFTNKAAKEMKSRIETIIGGNTRFSWIGTFHSMCARMLRREIDGYKTPEGWQWTSNFVIYDETDSLNVMKAEIKKLNLDEKVYPPKEMRHAISALKNDGYTYDLYARGALAYRERKIADIFQAYQRGLAQNNAFDFDDLILVFTDLLRTRPDVRARLMHRYRHLLIDEFQDTNKAQYEFVRLLADIFSSPEEISAGRARSLKGVDEREINAKWHERSLMVVGDVDQSIYSWRKADYKIFLGFQNDFPNSRIIKLEENYRSTSTILDIANSVIGNNVERIDKVLRCNRAKGAKAQYYEASDQIDEAFYVVEELKRLKARGRAYSDATILYRTNAQSRAIEEVLIRSGVPYTVVGGTKFYDRQEIKDLVAYLKVTFNPKDGQSFNRVVNQPKRGIGKTSLERLAAYADQRGVSQIEAALEAQRIVSIAPKTAGELWKFANCVFSRWRPRATPEREVDGQVTGYKDPISGLLQMILDDTRYMDMLAEDAMNSKDELAIGRMENIRELLAVAKEFEAIADEPDLESFLTRISLVSDLDSVETEGGDNLRLMTLHSAKGLEFPVVFLMGLEEGILPHMRSLESDSALEEERRLMYVGVTRAEDLLYLTRSRKRSFINRSADGSSGFTASMLPPSRFLKEITPGLLTGYYPGESPADDEPEQSYGGGGGGYGGGGGVREGERGGYERGGYGNRGGYEGRYGDQRGERRTTSGGGSGGGSYGNDRNGYSSSRPGSGSGGDRRPAAGSNNGRVYRAGQRADAGAGSAQSNLDQRRQGLRAYSNQNSPPGIISSNSGARRPEVAKGSDLLALPYERLSVGDVVQHTKFGVGKVVKVEGEGNKELYVINFDTAGERTLDPHFAKLIKLS